MRSTFMGLETARRGMFTQQTGLYTTGHNISNANTPGYTRQRVNFETTNPYPNAGLNRPMIPGQMGTGVRAGTIERIRDSFIDTQYRMENNKLGHFGTLSTALSKMEDIMNEPSKNGLHSVMEKFWDSLQDLAGHTENTGARDVVASNGQMVADTLNYYYNSITRVQGDLGHEIVVTERNVNKILENIEALNQQIAEIEPQGYIPNDLYDERDMLVDQLSEMMNIKVTKVKPENYGNAKDIAEGKYVIELVRKDRTSFDDPPVLLVDEDGANKISLGDSSGDQRGDDNELDGPISSITVDGYDPISTENLIVTNGLSGSLAGLIQSYGYIDGDGNEKGYYPDMIADLNKMTLAFATEFNIIHQEGYSLGEEDPSGLDFFVFLDQDGNEITDLDDLENPILSIAVNKEIIDDPAKIAAGDGDGNSGNNKNAQKLADIKGKNFKEYGVDIPEGLSGNVNTFYSGIIGKLGVDAQSVNKDANNSQVLLDSVDYNRKSVSAVSLDEEMINMIQFQHAYNAGARNITVIDEMLDKIINGMGVVGR